MVEKPKKIFTSQLDVETEQKLMDWFMEGYCGCHSTKAKYHDREPEIRKSTRRPNELERVYLDRGLR
jgi:hypothetical protein